jgi:hypothetical protein
MAKKGKVGHKLCPGCNRLIKGTRTKVCPKCGHEFNGKFQEVAPVEAAVAPAAEKPAKAGDAITLDQIKAVAQTVQAIGGMGRLNELMGLIKEVGGPRRFRELAEAMAITAPVEAGQ